MESEALRMGRGEQGVKHCGWGEGRVMVQREALGMKGDGTA